VVETAKSFLSKDDSATTAKFLQLGTTNLLGLSTTFDVLYTANSVRALAALLCTAPKGLVERRTHAAVAWKSILSHKR
jgi:hypothetical protein